jgi:UDP-2,3-diacylglucosamine pyrophosphatase LpxH
MNNPNAKPWSQKEVELLQRISHKPITDIVEDFRLRYLTFEPDFENRSFASIKKKLARLNKNTPTAKPAAKSPSKTTAKVPQTNIQNRLEDKLAKLKEIQAQYTEPSVRIQRGVIDPIDICRKIVSISDLHVPFVNTDMLDHVIKTHAGPNTWMVVNGDLLDGYAVFGIHEYRAAFEIVNTLRQNFEKVFLTSGNHDKRLARALKDVGWGTDKTNILGPDLLARIANGEELDENGILIQKHYWDNVFYDRKESWYVRIGKAIFFHPSTKPASKPGETVAKWSKKFQDRYAQEELDCMIMGHCFDEETEILTKRGWQNIWSICDEDEVGTMNLTSDAFEWNPIEDVWRYKEHKTLIKIGMDDRLQIAVTPEHGMIWKTNNDCISNKPWRLTQAHELLDRAQAVIPTSAIEINNTDYPISDDLLKLVAWTISEGSICSRGYVRIAQSNDHNKYCDELDQLVNNLGIKHSRSLRYKANSTVHGMYRNYDAYRWNISAEGSRQITPYLTSDKILKSDVALGLSQRQRLLFLTELCKGDGSKCGTDVFRHYYTKNINLKDQVQMLLTLSGFSSNSKMKKGGLWYISFSNTTEKYVSDFREEEYDGHTWCLTVPNGSLVARRRGWVFITQNTHKIYEGVINGYKLIEQGTLAGFIAYAFAPTALYDGNGQNGYAVIYQDKEGNTCFNNSHVVYLGEIQPPKKSVVL